MLTVTIAQSKITAQGQISVPAEVRKKLGVGPGSMIEWHEQDDQIVVKRVGLNTSSEVHAALFPAPPASAAIDTKEAIRKQMRKRHARG